MKKLLLIPTLATASLAPLVAFTSCSCDPKANTTFVFSEEEKTGEVITGQKIIHYFGHCDTNSTPPVPISQLCHLINLKWGDDPIDDEDIFDVRVDVTDPAIPQPEHPYDVEITLTYDGDFAFGTYLFDFVFVWYENGDYHHIYEQTITSFVFYEPD